MKSIELTGKHRELLLEMCKTLFPDVRRWYFCYSEEEEMHEMFLSYKDGPMIHWFEFCITFLSEEIFERLEHDSDEMQDFLSDLFLHYYSNTAKSGHPVDYLYEQFKKLKL